MHLFILYVASWNNINFHFPFSFMFHGSIDINNLVGIYSILKHRPPPLPLGKAGPSWWGTDAEIRVSQANPTSFPQRFSKIFSMTLFGKNPAKSRAGISPEHSIRTRKMFCSNPSECQCINIDQTCEFGVCNSPKYLSKQNRALQTCNRGALCFIIYLFIYLCENGPRPVLREARTVNSGIATLNIQPEDSILWEGLRAYGPRPVPPWASLNASPVRHSVNACLLSQTVKDTGAGRISIDNCDEKRVYFSTVDCRFKDFLPLKNI